MSFLPEPAPKPLTHVSPTSYEDLRACLYRVALETSRLVRPRPSPRASVGTIAQTHDLAAKGAFKDADPTMLRRRLRESWDGLVEQAWERVATAWDPAEPPPPEEWPGMALTRSRTIRHLARELAARQPAHDTLRVPTIAAPPIQTELALQDDARHLKGRIDRLERDGRGLTVIDLKSGVAQEGVSDSQQRQLLLYAVLVHGCLGEWPHAAAIESASGVQYPIEVARDEAETIALDAERRLAAYNAAVNGGPSSLEELADPSVEHCGWCPQRVGCRPYWEHVTSDWPFQGAVLGTVAGAEATSSGRTARIVPDLPADRKGIRTSVYGAWPWAVAPGEMVAIVGASQVGGQEALRLERETRVGRRDANGRFVT